jgi:hypothetical protein
MTTASARKLTRKNRRRSNRKLRSGTIAITLAAATRAIPTTVAGHFNVQPRRGPDDDGECEEITQEEQAFCAARSAFGKRRRDVMRW